MKKSILIFTILISSSFVMNAQAIRKNFLEMTDSEKTDLVDAFYQLRDMDNDGITTLSDPNPDDDDIINNIGDYHAEYFNKDAIGDGTDLDIHFNLPDEAIRDIFLAWHRELTFEVEQLMQDINPNIGMPYWNSVQDDGYDNSAIVTIINNTLFTSDFLGPFNADWGLNRNTGNNINFLPTNTEITNLFNQTGYLNFSNQFERGKGHTGAHVWVGGVMQSHASPKDPVFYLHHTYVDKLWNDWEIANQSSSFIRTDMLRYDGTYTFHGVTLPSVNPNSIIDSKVYGTFYAENQLAELEGYTVSNTYNSTETFYYQFKIQSGNDFTVPNTKICAFESINEIVLTPGFTAETGSTFTAKIDVSPSARTSHIAESRKGVRNPFNYKIPIVWDAYENINDTAQSNDMHIKVFPNPFFDKINFNLSKEVENCKVEIYNMIGVIVRAKIYEDVQNIELNDLSKLPNGTYLIKISDNKTNEVIAIEKFLKQ